MNTTAEDLAYVAFMDDQAGQAEAAERRAFEDWAERRRADGDDASEDAYADWLDAQLPLD